MKSLFTALLTCFILFASAQSDIPNVTANLQQPLNSQSGIRISLLTVGPGHQEIYEPFGHTAFRVTDSSTNQDLVYSYGTFNGYEKGFELKFMQGKLLYYLSVSPYFAFDREYAASGRSVQEQVLDLPMKEKMDIRNFLEDNAMPANRYYKYDFLFDNCATRIRDVLPKTFNDRFKYGKNAMDGAHISYRRIIDQYLYKEHLARFGIDILLGSRVDKIMSNEDAMFLPDFLRDGMTNAKVDNKAIAGEPVMLISGDMPPGPGLNWALVITASVLLLTMLGLSIPQLRLVGVVMSKLVLIVNGLLGVLILVMWFATDHQSCQNNFNVLWALPTSIMLVASRRKADKYILVAVFLLFVSLLLHIFKIQELPLFELWPWLLSLLFIYGTIYKRDRTVKNA